jgi:hypothetical protein
VGLLLVNYEVVEVDAARFAEPAAPVRGAGEGAGRSHLVPFFARLLLLFLDLLAFVLSLGILTGLEASDHERRRGADDRCPRTLVTRGIGVRLTLSVPCNSAVRRVPRRRAKAFLGTARVTHPQTRRHRLRVGMVRSGVRHPPPSPLLCSD